MNEDEVKWLAEFDANEKKQTSYSGKRSFKEFANPDKNIEERFDIDKLHKLGGDRLVTLYLCGSNYELAAKELGIKQFTLRRHILRLRSKLVSQGMTKEKLKSWLFNTTLTSK